MAPINKSTNKTLRRSSRVAKRDEAANDIKDDHESPSIDSNKFNNMIKGKGKALPKSVKIKKTTIKKAPVGNKALNQKGTVTNKTNPAKKKHGPTRSSARLQQRSANAPPTNEILIISEPNNDEPNEANNTHSPSEDLTLTEEQRAFTIRRPTIHRAHAAIRSGAIANGNFFFALPEDHPLRTTPVAGEDVSPDVMPAAPPRIMNSMPGFRETRVILLSGI
ncbi:hypothetical protein AUEXF2481DRAFT_3299 [Aureobasidium subglaciale EXF-2481]|uniref:Uncharacterized protein n=1 Tax=Aureobasidium subglaciale (strain EXF-2481) TaxID=1043005 RepID=A0A074YI48_AURSE|nr:uncharacterized protein AUEXF2481DRAFT_3299 [Aureobasidium subglaciale EXF-2481]KAI5195000.1 hypothetical protein E4T38_09312 [Aureobasidium subglaciale]KAI5214081.1 hypothetical protein E4T40_09263 [Aureobasidium subglaciale]KAI5216484.1 hypothetical protein E4T41_09264 [Aureobasidium subglaciale]KAI5254399.1 hypothetical protein E4T46_09219 [Aureobasidium subglaciale]KEQ97493.1 hypothetical protein AUEXF2481DRAFT_3299 [Aureobasidium subglaciale EXF-2481]